jgi:hypothetical protein
MILKVTLQLEHDRFGVLKYFSEREIYDNSKPPNIVYMCCQMAGYVAVQMCMGLMNGIASGQFTALPVEVKRVRRKNGEIEETGGDV